jgi:hypothetical protein
MCDYKPTVMLWLRQTKGADQVRRVHEQLAGLTGVLAAISSSRNPHLVLIKYDQQHISSQKLLRVARNHDQTARLVGI